MSHFKLFYVHEIDNECEQLTCFLVGLDSEISRVLAPTCYA
jgi:hypothetical protein